MRSHLWIYSLCVIECLAGSASAQSRPLANDTVAFINVNVVPMDRDRILTRRTVVVGGGRILMLGSVDSVVVPAHVMKIDGKNRLFVAPGLAEMHAHIRYESDLALMVANGITTVRNMRGIPWHLDLREKVASGQLLGPRIVTAGPVFYGSRGTGATPAEAKALVDSQANAHYDFVKVYDGLSPEAYAAVVAEAAARGLPVAGHIGGGRSYGDGLIGALQAHQLTIEHAEQLIYHYFGDDLDTARIPAIASQIGHAGTFVTPTLTVITSLILQWEQPDSVMAWPEMRYVHPETYAWWKTDRGHDAAINRLFVPFLNAVVRGLRDAHVPMLAGTDYYIFGGVAGFALHRELQALVDAGLTPYEALATATIVPAELFHDTAASGTVAVGKIANLVVFSGNPLADISNTKHIAGVMLRGKWLPSAELDSMKSKIAAGFAAQQRLVDDLMQHGAAASSLRPGVKVPVFGQSTVSQIVDYFLRAKRSRDAVAVAALVTRAYPGSASAWIALADGYVAEQRTADARAALERALRIDPSSAEARKKLGDLSAPALHH